jgi:hypothetical protein
MLMGNVIDLTVARTQLPFLLGSDSESLLQQRVEFISPDCSRSSLQRIVPKIMPSHTRVWKTRRPATVAAQPSNGGFDPHCKSGEARRRRSSVGAAKVLPEIYAWCGRYAVGPGWNALPQGLRRPSSEKLRNYER